MDFLIKRQKEHFAVQSWGDTGFLQASERHGHRGIYAPTPAANDDYVPYIYSRAEISMIFQEADSLEYHRQNQCRNIQIEFPMVLRMLYGCGLRIGETLALEDRGRGP